MLRAHRHGARPCSLARRSAIRRTLAGSALPQLTVDGARRQDRQLRASAARSRRDPRLLERRGCNNAVRCTLRPGLRRRLLLVSPDPRPGCPGRRHHPLPPRFRQRACHPPRTVVGCPIEHRSEQLCHRNHAQCRGDPRARHAAVVAWPLGRQASRRHRLAITGERPGGQHPFFDEIRPPVHPIRHLGCRRLALGAWRHHPGRHDRRFDHDGPRAAAGGAGGGSMEGFPDGACRLGPFGVAA